MEEMKNRLISSLKNVNQSQMTGKEWNKEYKKAATRLLREKLDSAAGQQSSSEIDGLVHVAQIGSDLLSNIEGWPAGLESLAKLAKIDVKALVKSPEKVKLPEKLSFEAISGLSALTWLSKKEFEVIVDGRETVFFGKRHFDARELTHVLGNL